ncbi:pyridoxal phosphate-dependent aminotransferase [Niveibacterium sp. SC-1]|uniref:pyridoxal phosphate-dependent aminotransferase n=1 Tax=Niveibacterium sp. SC-1 TaxID=3135646 RepID=UPI00311F7B82
MSEYTPTLPAGPIATRASSIAPFHVMELLSRAQALEAQGRDVIHMEVGEPDFPTPEPIIRAAQDFLARGRVGYTPAAGLPQLREAIAAHYADDLGVTIDPARIIVTAGASGALLLTLAALTEAGDEWLLPDPGYPCNPHFVRAFEGVPRALPVGPEHNFEPDPQQVARAWQPRTRGLIVASPANPTGTLVSPATMAALYTTVRNRGGALIVDEIYQRLVYGEAACTALQLGEEVFVINSFSKYFGMTGWRLGWVVAPQEYARAIEKLAQHYFISASTPAQFAALAAFTSETRSILEARRLAFAERRTVLHDGLRSLGFEVPAAPQGAFYVYARVDSFTEDSQAFAHQLLDEAGVACTPGIDFGGADPQHWLRFAYTTDSDRIAIACERIRAVTRRL